MNGRKGKSKKILIMLFAVLAALIAMGLGATIFCAWYSNGWESSSPFYVKYSGELASDELTVLGSKASAIEVRAAGFNKSVEGYTVQVVPETKNDFDYTVNGLHYRFSAAGELSEDFKVKIHDGYFTFIPLIPEKLLEARHGAAITTSDKIPTSKSYYKIVVTSADGKKTIVLSLKVSSGVTGIILSPDNIIL